ncbi:MAG TPA: FAD-dependent oxidoreductase [Pyrinomonadaceae bacterium]|jgi:glycine/D-amino acid oxidase-like deaminating enzyme/nitrite reductase/ring-hydroxylating ferredoxin subunit|nr:FAD-dependent oxidoreductase [Pyrinomonadaceae bacterium]
MKDDSGETTSPWWAVDETPRSGPLERDARADVCVVGAGIAGLTTACLLAREGLHVVVLDDGVVGGGETGRTTAHLTNVMDERFYNLEGRFGERGSRLAAESHGAAIDLIERLAREEKIDCDFERLDGYLFVPPGCSKDELERELDAAHRAGLRDAEWAERAPIEDFDTGRCLRFPRQAQFSPLKYVAGLARAIRRDGGRIHTHTHASEIRGGSPARVTTSRGHTVTCGAVVVATNAPVIDRLLVSTREGKYRTYAIGAHVPRGSVTKALYWDTPDPYHYVRTQKVKGASHDLLIVGGEDERTGDHDDGDERFAELYRWTRRRWPMIGKIEFQWSGQIVEPTDGLAYIGRMPLDQPNVLIATGDSGQGMTHGTIAGMLLTDLIQGRRNEWASLYDPSRLRSATTTDFVNENLNVIAHYTDWLTGGEVDSTAEIEPGEGCIVRCGLTKVAAYRDEDGVLHQRQAVCTHAGCPVSWNSTEKSWDCPCHGSRFDRYGRVVNGPANRNLSGTRDR